MRAALLLSAVLLISACADPRSSPPRPGALVETRLYLGLSTPTGTVSDGDLDRFLDEEVVPRFPDGLTLLRGEGRWRASDGTQVREGSVVLDLLHPDDASRQAALVALITAYKQRFQQQSVLVVRSAPRVQFR